MYKLRKSARHAKRRITSVIKKILDKVRIEYPKISPHLKTGKDLQSSQFEKNSIEFTKREKLSIGHSINSETPKNFEQYIGIHKVNPNKLYTLRNVTLFSDYAVPVTEDKKYILEELVRKSTVKRILKKTSDKFILAKIFGPKALTKFGRYTKKNNEAKKELGENIINLVPRHFGGPSHKNHGNYGHWVAEDLPRLKGLRKFCRHTGKDAKILIKKDPPSWMTESLNLLGFSDSDYIEWSGGCKTVSTLVVPEVFHFHSKNTELNPVGRRWVGETIKENIDTFNLESTPSRIFASRQGSGFRKIKNFEEVSEVLGDYGIVPIRNEEMSVKSQVQHFSEADLVVGAFGANLANIIFSTDATVIEIFDYGDIRPVYFVSSSEQRLDYGYVMGEEGPEVSQGWDSDILVDTNKLRCMIEKVT